LGGLDSQLKAEGLVDYVALAFVVATFVEHAVVNCVVATFVEHAVVNYVVATFVEHVVATFVRHVVYFTPVVVDIFTLFEVMLLGEVVIFLIEVIVAFEAVTATFHVIGFAIRNVAAALVIVHDVIVRAVHFGNDI
jgi:hypothetical protein